MSDQPRIVQVEILRDYRSEHIHFRAGEIVSIEEDFAQQLILSDCAQYVDDEFDREIERITAANPEAVARMIACVDGELTAGRCRSMDTLFEKQDPKSAGLKIGDKVRAIRDFWVEPLFDEGWDVKKGMVGFVYALDLEDDEIAVDFNAALGGGTEKGDIVLVVRLDAIEPISD
jgi:hypothetical protein